MNPITEIPKYADRLRELGVVRLFVFGSFARGDARADSDVDVLVDFEGTATLTSYMDVKFFLEDVLGRRVDLVTTKALRREIKDNIDREAVRVA